MLLLDCTKESFLNTLRKESYPSLGEEDFEKISLIKKERFVKLLHQACNYLNALNIYLERSCFAVFSSDQKIEPSYFSSGCNYYYGIQEGFRYKGIYEMVANIILFLED